MVTAVSSPKRAVGRNSESASVAKPSGEHDPGEQQRVAAARERVAHRGARRHALAARALEAVQQVDGVVHHHAERDARDHHRDHVERHARDRHPRERQQHRHDVRHHRHQRPAERAQQQREHREDREQGGGERLDLAVEQVLLHAREHGHEARHRGVHAGHAGERFARGGLDAQQQRVVLLGVERERARREPRLAPVVAHPVRQIVLGHRLEHEGDALEARASSGSARCSGRLEGVARLVHPVGDRDAAQRRRLGVEEGLELRDRRERRRVAEAGGPIALEHDLERRDAAEPRLDEVVRAVQRMVGREELAVVGRDAQPRQRGETGQREERGRAEHEARAALREGRDAGEQRAGAVATGGRGRPARARAAQPARRRRRARRTPRRRAPRTRRRCARSGSATPAARRSRSRWWPR